MKKLLIFLFAILGLFATSQTQTTPAKKATPAIDSAAAPLKKDGSPDMRFSKNKEAAKTAPRLKKDGTPDKRYKRNKKA